MTSRAYLALVPVPIQTDSNGQLTGFSATYAVKHNEAVDFVVEDPVRVVVSFDQTSCLTQTGPFYLDGSDPSKAATGPIPVRSDATKGPYPFTVAPDTSPGSGEYKKPGDFEAKSGTLEVTSDSTL